MDRVSELLWTERPVLEQPVLIAAFEGWNDAGEAATHALGWLAREWGAETVAEIDPEHFYDFTATRPSVRIAEGDVRHIEWPANRLSVAHPPGGPDVVLLSGIEPHYRWRSFSRLVIEAAESLGARLVVTLGALLADVPHSRPTAVYGTAGDRQVMDALHLEPSRYEGPTGIVGVLAAECRARDVRTASFWAAVPSYVAAAPSPKAAHALVARVGALLGVDLDCSELAEAAVDYESQISALVAEDDETLAYVRHLEEAYDTEEEQSPPSETVEPARAQQLVAEVERFLRDR